MPRFYFYKYVYKIFVIISLRFQIRTYRCSTTSPKRTWITRRQTREVSRGRRGPSATMGKTRRCSSGTRRCTWFLNSSLPTCYTSTSWTRSAGICRPTTGPNGQDGTPRSRYDYPDKLTSCVPTDSSVHELRPNENNFFIIYQNKKHTSRELSSSEN